jgi:group I intron endonuclease
MFVYKIVNILNEKVYIGVTSKNLKTRYDWHLRDCKKGIRKKLYSAMRELGIEKFSIELLEECNDKSLIKDREEFYIELYDSYKEGYNASPKSGGVKFHSENTKKIMSEKAKGRKASNETKLKQSRSLKKFWSKKTPDELIMFSESIKGRNKGRKCSEEFRKNCSERLIGRKLSEETKKKMSETKQGKVCAKIVNLICPFCNKTGVGNAMLRWHFDKCRKRK